MNLTQLREKANEFMKVQRTPIHYGSATYGVEARPSSNLAKNHVGLVDEKTNVLISVVSKHYNVVQHGDMTDAMVNALETLNLNAEAKVRDGGNRLFIDFEFPDVRLMLREVGEEFIGGIRLVNSYDKSTGIMVLPMLKRLVCSNGMVMTAGYVRPFIVKHTSRLSADLQKIIPQILKDLVDNSPRLQLLVSGAMRDSCGFAEIGAIAKKLIPTKKHREGILAVIGTTENANIGSINRWQLFNAVTYYCSHTDKLRPTTEMSLQNVANRILLTPFTKLRGEQDA